MRISDTGVWGYHSDSVLQQGKKYKTIKVGLYTVDIAVVCLSTVAMYERGGSSGSYLGLVLVVSALHTILSGLCIDAKVWRAYILCKRYKDSDVIRKELRVTCDDLYSALYHASRSKLRRESDVKYYVDVITDACKMSDKYSSKILKELLAIKESDEGSKIYVYYATHGRKQALLGVFGERTSPDALNAK